MPNNVMSFFQAFLSSLLILTLGLLLWFGLNIELSLLGRIGWWSLGLGAIGGVLLYICVFYLTRLFWIRLSSLRSLMSYLHRLFKDFSWFSIVIISVMAGVGEELLVRGVLQSYLISHFNPVIGIVLASLTFGLMHYLTKTYVMIAFALGLLFGLAYYISESMALVMVAHAVYDVVAFAIIVKYPHLLKINVELDEYHIQGNKVRVSEN